MADMDLKPGDVVEPKSGGPTMTIISISGDTAVCVWVDKSKVCREPIELIALRRYNPTDFYTG